MKPADQRERDDLALVLDTWLAIIAVELIQEERLSQPMSPTRVTPLVLQKKLRRAELLRKAS